jgi:hypothetical protein
MYGPLCGVLDQEPPFEHHLLADREHALIEHRPHLVGEPVVQFGAARGVGEAFDSKADLSETDRTDIEAIERLRCDEGDDVPIRLRAAQLGENIGVEEPSGHRLMSRTGIGARFGSISTSR